MSSLSTASSSLILEQEKTAAAQQKLEKLKNDHDTKAMMVVKAQTKFRDLVPHMGIDVIPGAKVGVRIGNVVPNTSAELCGLKQQDIILQVNGETMRSGIDFRNICKKVRPGEQLVLQIQRGRAQMAITLNVAAKGVKYEDVLRLRRISGNNVLPEDEAFINALK
jgi:S1-C subfamily serine protease